MSDLNRLEPSEVEALGHIMARALLQGGSSYHVMQYEEYLVLDLSVELDTSEVELLKALNIEQFG